MLTKHRKYRGRQPYNNSRPSRLGAGPSAETAELAGGARARRRRSWPEIGDGGTGPVPGDVGARPELGGGGAGSGLGDGGAGPVPETTELAIDRRRRRWPVRGDGEALQRLGDGGASQG